MRSSSDGNQYGSTLRMRARGLDSAMVRRSAAAAGGEALAGWVQRPLPLPRLQRLSVPRVAGDEFGVSVPGLHELIGRAATSAAVAEVLVAAVRPFGMELVAALPVVDCGPAASPFLFTNWPQAWVACHAAAGAGNDPARRWALLSGQAIDWPELRHRLPVSDCAHSVYAVAVAQGYGAWLFAPIRTDRGRLGVVAMAGRRAPMRPGERDALRLAAEAAYNRADALAGRDLPALSPREAACVTQLALGAQFSEIASLLGVSVTTIRFHLDNARRKMGARSCTHLIALTIATGLQTAHPEENGQTSK